MRFSTWAAVSSEKQLDNASLPEQENKCKAVGTAKGWQDTGLTYMVPGESRTRYVNLRDAENEIPALRAMLEDAKAGRFDLLLLYDYNRLRDLLDPVAKTLASYGVQLYSISQAVDPLPPDEFNPYASDSESMVRGLAQIISRWQIADLKRKFRYGVTARVRKGLHSIRTPYGYKAAPDKTLPAVPVPEQAQAVVLMKDLFLKGKTYKEIARVLNEQGIPTARGRRWEHSLIKLILLNPFYAGKVFFGRTKTLHDPHLNTTRVIPNPTPLMVDGQHEALFTWEEHVAILAEDERRRSHPRHTRYAFSGLLRCSICDRVLIHDISYSAPVWHCPGRYHTLLRDEEAFALIPRALQQALYDVTPGSPIPSLPVPMQTLSDLERQRLRVHDRLERGIYTDDEAEGKIKAIEAQIQAYRNDEANRVRREVEHKQFLTTVEEARPLLPRLPSWIRGREPKIVNALLLRLCEKIVITPDGKITVQLRE